ncbi:hypothetical protein KIN20_016107 [Parelaphostrongylus tenuis]|uniref:Uncharacterized protein n=1 Tax=Parelaphostrongylus tenuis TaxID=148309 RepID=A0AAD5QQH4_PARTN|nr:hypothetical protein KIN20_016107 [Parelaphostrongylus tenuis]
MECVEGGCCQLPRCPSGLQATQRCQMGIGCARGHGEVVVKNHHLRALMVVVQFRDVTVVQTVHQDSVVHS